MDALIWSDIISNFVLTFYVFTILSVYLHKEKRNEKNIKNRLNENHLNEKIQIDNKDEEKIEIVIVQ